MVIVSSGWGLFQISYPWTVVLLFVSLIDSIRYGEMQPVEHKPSFLFFFLFSPPSFDGIVSHSYGVVFVIVHLGAVLSFQLNSKMLFFS
jgi:hypothetical protein